MELNIYIYGGVSIGQVKAANYCVPPYTILASITWVFGLKKGFDFFKVQISPALSY